MNITDFYAEIRTLGEHIIFLKKYKEKVHYHKDIPKETMGVLTRNMYGDAMFYELRYEGNPFDDSFSKKEKI